VASEMASSSEDSESETEVIQDRPAPPAAQRKARATKPSAEDLAAEAAAPAREQAAKGSKSTAHADTKSPTKGSSSNGKTNGAAQLEDESEDEESDDGQFEEEEEEERIVLNTNGRNIVPASGNLVFSDDEDGAVAAKDGAASSSSNAQANAAEGDGEDDEDDEDENAVDDEGNIKDMNAEFLFCDPKDDDFFMVKSLLTQGTTALVPGIENELSDLTNDICEQCASGTTITVDGDVYTFISALSGGFYGKKKYMQKFRSLLESKCPAVHKNALKTALRKGFAWLLSERLINMPHHVVPPLHKSIAEDVEWARENVAETGGSADMFEFDYFVFVAPCYVGEDKEKINNESDDEGDDDEEDEEEQEQHGGKQRTVGGKSKASAGKRAAPLRKKAKANEVDLDSAFFLYFEHEVLIKKATIKFPISLSTPTVLEGKAKGAVPQRHKPRHAFVGVIPVKTHASLISELNEIVSA